MVTNTLAKVLTIYYPIRTFVIELAILGNAAFSPDRGFQFVSRIRAKFLTMLVRIKTCPATTEKSTDWDITVTNTDRPIGTGSAIWIPRATSLAKVRPFQTGITVVT